tara:strand:+ start:929 stop:1327 length:399 start_codon:yes stop_codon:yes gene_type:complete
VKSRNHKKNGAFPKSLRVGKLKTKKMKKGNIKVSILYPNGEDKNFDINYYCNVHVPMAAKLLGKAVLGATVENGLGGGEPGSKPTYAAMGNLYFASVESFQNSFGPHSEKIMGDLPNFTNINPVIQISEVMI